VSISAEHQFGHVVCPSGRNRSEMVGRWAGRGVGGVARRRIAKPMRWVPNGSARRARTLQSGNGMRHPGSGCIAVSVSRGLDRLDLSGIKAAARRRETAGLKVAPFPKSGVGILVTGGPLKKTRALRQSPTAKTPTGLARPVPTPNYRPSDAATHQTATYLAHPAAAHRCCQGRRWGGGLDRCQNYKSNGPSF
jgi:hypothetical protein